MTSQQEADNVLSFWQAQRAAGVPAERRLPSNALLDFADRDFERDLNAVRHCMEQVQ